MPSDEVLYDETKNINGVAKFLLVKVSVGMIILLGLVAQFLITANKAPYVDDSNYSVADKTTRAECKLTEITALHF